MLPKVDNPAPTVSKSGRPIELLPSGPISLIGHNAPSLAVLMHRNVRLKKTTKRSKVSPPVVAATLAQAFKGTSIATGTSSQTGKSAKTRSTQTSSADAPQPSQAKRKGPKNTKSQPKRQRTAPSSPPRPTSPIHVASSPSSPKAQTQEALSPPRQVPQQQEAPADVAEQVVDPADLSTSSAVLPEQTITIPHQVEVIPSATLADQPIVPAASPRQIREITLKQEQDSPDSLFSFAIEISDDEGEEASSSQAIGI